VLSAFRLQRQPHWAAGAGVFHPAQE